MIFRNKKGADSTMGPMIWLIVILIVAALVIFFVAGGFDKISGLFDQAPGTFTAAVEFCETFTQPSTFCEQARYVSINGEAQYVNCKYSAILDQLEMTSDVECNVPNGYNDNWGNYFCSGLFKSGDVKSNTKANGVYCSSLSCAELNGEPKPSDVACPSDKPKRLTKGFVDSNINACCLA